MKSWRESAIRAVPAGIFVGLILVRRDAFAASIAALTSATSSQESARAGLMLVHQLLGSCFYLFIAALLLRRLPAIARAGGLKSTVLAFAGTFGAAPLALMPATTDSIALTLFADVVTAVGLLLSCYSVAVLGRHFGIRAVARGVVTSGPYAHVRHPLYVSEAVTQLGILLVVLSPAAVLSFVVYLGLQYRRAVVEEGVLAESFPGYRDYQARTSRFVPGLI